jgi:hypothetical protein
VVKDVLAAPIDPHAAHPSVRQRILAAGTYLGEISARADGILAARWSEARDELDSLTVRSNAIAAMSKPDFSEFKELEELKEKRSDVVKSLIKISDSLQLIEPALLEGPDPTGAAAPLPAGGRRGALDPAQLRDRNFRHAEETKAIARRELERLRLLIQRITAISRGGFVDSETTMSLPRAGEREQRARQTSDGVDLASLPDAELHAKLGGCLARVATSLREFRGKVDGVRRRILKSELQHALNVLFDKTKRAADACDGSEPDPGAAVRTADTAEGIMTALREILAAQTNVAARVNSAKLTPAEKQPLASLLSAMKLRLGDDLRDVERMCAELAGRSAGAAPPACGAAEPAAAEEPVAADVVVPATEAAADRAVFPEAAAAAAAASPEDPARTAAANQMVGLVAAIHNAQRPVKELMIGLNSTFARDLDDKPAIRAAASALKSGIAEAQDVMMANMMQIEALAASFNLPLDRYVERFDRWRGQLSALETETERLLRSLARVSDVRNDVTAAAASEKGIADTLRPPPGERNRDEPFIPVRQRCREALAAIADSLRHLREAQHSLSAARDAEWRILKSASRYVGSLCSELSVLEQELRDTHARIEAIHNHFKSDRPRTR